MTALLVDWRTEDEVRQGIPLDPDAEGYHLLPISMLRESANNPRKQQ